MKNRLLAAVMYLIIAIGLHLIIGAPITIKWLAIGLVVTILLF